MIIFKLNRIYSKKSDRQMNTVTLQKTRKIPKQTRIWKNAFHSIIGTAIDTHTHSLLKMRRFIRFSRAFAFNFHFQSVKTVKNKKKEC